MRQFLCAASVSLFCLVSVSLVRADDPAAAATLDKAIKALGGEEKLAKIQAFSWKAKGKLTIQGNENDFESQVTMQGLDHLRREFGNERFHMISVVSGDKGWRRLRDETREIAGDGLTVEKQAIYLQAVPITLLPLKSKAFKYEAAADEKVGDKPAAVLKVIAPDGKDFTLYFDKESGLPVKEVAKLTDPGGNGFAMEVTFADYKEFGGIKKATKIEVRQNGQISQVLEVTEFKVLEKVDPETFAEPK
jgi:hypothetical protein